MTTPDYYPGTSIRMYGLTVEETWRRFDFSQWWPPQVYGHGGPWALHLVLLPDNDPEYLELWSWYGYCGGPTQGVGYMALDESGLWLCDACATWADIKRTPLMRQAAIIGGPDAWIRRPYRSPAA